MVLMTVICEMFWSFVLSFIYYEFGEKTSNGFSEFSDGICQINWHSFPIEIQRMMPTVMNVAHQPVLIRGFGILPYLRESSKIVCPDIDGLIHWWNWCFCILFQVINSAFSYFMMLRQVGSWGCRPIYCFHSEHIEI